MSAYQIQVLFNSLDNAGLLFPMQCLLWAAAAAVALKVAQRGHAMYKEFKQ